MFSFFIRISFEKKKFYGFEKNLLEALHLKDKSDNKITRVQTK